MPELTEKEKKLSKKLRNIGISGIIIFGVGFVLASIWKFTL